MDIEYIYIEPCPRCGAKAEVKRDGKYEEWDCPKCGIFSSYEIDGDIDNER